MKNTEAALKMIFSVLGKHAIPFRITGGFAARLYGSTRELADIDIGVPEACFKKIVPNIKNYIIFGPARYQDENWDLYMMTLNYKGQEIDICAVETEKIFDQETKEWKNIPADLVDLPTKKIYGIKIPVMRLEDLMQYKSKLQREVDIEDVRQITKYVVR